MVTIKIYPAPSKAYRERLKRIIKMYHGKASFSGTGIIMIQKEENFNYDNLANTLNSLGFQLEVL